MYEYEVADILANAQSYHDIYYKAQTFHGPSLYFHRRALESWDYPDLSRHLEYIYATLASWGMHRMGRGGAKMLDFETFRERRAVEG
jgi:hypothetical protein